MNPEEITLQILEGVSPLNLSGGAFFFKHPTIKQKLSDIKIQKDCEATGKKIGIKNEKQLIDEAIESGSWSRENEEKINDLEWLIEKTQSSIDKLSDHNLIQHNQQTVDGYKKELEELNLKRRQFTLASLENYSLSRSHSIFCERDCYVIKNGEKEPLREHESKKVMAPYMNIYTSLLNRDNLIKAAYNPLFFDLVYMSESPIEIFPDPINSITVFQKDLLFYAHVLSSKLKNLEIPDSIRSNPVELFNFKPKKDGEKEKEQFNPRKFVESKGGLEKMKPEDKL